jgi:hypothetical protein
VNAPQEWESTPAGILRRAAGAVPEPAFPPPPGAGLVAPTEPAELESRRVQHEEFTRAWAPVLATQHQLAAQGWPGRIIPVPDTRPAPLKALDMAVAAAKSMTEVTGPGLPPLSTERAARARFEAAQERQEASNPCRGVA